MNNYGSFKPQNRVLLICDYYYSRHIIKDLLDKKGNLALFPIANKPLIEYILENLYKNNLKTVYLAGGEALNSINEYLENSVYAKKMSIKIIDNESMTFGDMIRCIDEQGHKYDSLMENLLVMFANTFTNLNLTTLIEHHRRNKKKDSSVVMTVLLQPHGAINSEIPVYGMNGDEVIYYKTMKAKEELDIDFLDIFEKHGTISIEASYNIPHVFVVSAEIFPLFAENFDFHRIDELMQELTRSSIYTYKVKAVKYETPEKPKEIKAKPKETKTKQKTEKQITKNKKKNTQEELINLFDKMGLTDVTPYIHSINTLWDYKQMNFDALANKLYTSNNDSHSSDNYTSDNYTSDNCIIGDDVKILPESVLNESIIGDSCVIKGRINGCVLWDGAVVLEDDVVYSDCVIYDNGVVVCCVPVIEESSEEEEEPEVKTQSSFFDDLREYLYEKAKGGAPTPSLIAEMAQQVSLLRIVWNASPTDLTEIFAEFVVDMFNPEDPDNSTINASLFFPILKGHTKDVLVQEGLMSLIFDLLVDVEYETRKHAVLQYGFLLLEEGVINKKTIRKYQRLLEYDLLR
ncbi:Translation initiation factor eIF-2B subunit epsilon [Astathelohania contejeani]|uniref:Translation initiation factor eIF-2B subunit epsilon n=1 Tax=Astathelohania contejeani TaxID=164912 RepID=A0ABQ7HYC6_9MICR|nr:Translation initiation factor eIF-2B subunit epsilon [Thelohania contejeani]